MDIDFRVFKQSDIPFAMELKNIEGWNQTESDWRRYLLLEPDGCFIALYNGKPAGTVTTINYDKRFGWIGMVVVHPELRRRGIGTAILNKAIGYLKGIGVQTVKLDATPDGKKLYDKLGFVEEYGIVRRQGIGIVTDCEEFAPIRTEDLEDIINFDMNIFGARRGRVIQSLSTGFLARDQKGNVQGYIMFRKGLKAYHIGPWVSSSVYLADELFAFMLKMLAGEKVYLDIPILNENGLQIIDKYEFTVQRSFTRMFLGNNSYPGKPTNIYSTSSAEKG